MVGDVRGIEHAVSQPLQLADKSAVEIDNRRTRMDLDTENTYKIVILTNKAYT